MATLRHITSIDDAGADLAAYSNLTDAQLRARDFSGDRGVFIAEGELVVRKLIGSRFPVRSLLVTEPGLERIGDALERLPETTPVYVAPVDLLQQIVGFPFHRGVLACGERAPDPPLESLLAGARALVILEDLANHDNVGGIFRNAAAFGATGVLLDPETCDPLYRKAIRVSAGAALVVPFARCSSADAMLDLLDEYQPQEFDGYEIITAFTTEPAYIQSKEPVRDRSDLAGLELRTSGALTTALELLGAAPVGMPMPEVAGKRIFLTPISFCRNSITFFACGESAAHSIPA